MSNLRFLLDENVDPQLRSGLLRRDPAVVAWAVGEPGAPPRGTTDPAILQWCQAHGFVLVTYNRRSMPVHLQAYLRDGGHVPGILALHPNHRLGRAIEDVILIWEVALAGELADTILYLPLT